MALRVVTNLGEEATHRLVRIADEPDAFRGDPDAVPYRATGRKSLWRVTVDDAGTRRPVFLKIYRARGGPAGWKEILRASAGMQLWRITGQVEEAGIPTPRRLAAADRRHGPRLLDWTLFACEDLADATPLARLVQEARAWDASRRDAFARRLGVAFRGLEERGFFQPDLKPTNFLVRGDAGGEFALLPIDLRQCRMGRLDPAKRRRTERQLRERVLEGWNEDGRGAFFESYAARS